MMTATSNLSTLLHQGPPRGDIVKGLEQLRYAVLADGIPSNSDGMSDIRMYIWMILLSCPPMPTDSYLDLVRQGPSPSYEKIRNDTFRTLATDPLFRRRVTENSLTRVLNAIAWKLHDAHESRVNGWQSPPTLGYRPPPSFTTGSPELAGDSPAGTGVGVGGAARAMSVTAESDAAASTSAAAETTTGSSSAAAPVGYVQGMNVLAAPFLYAARSEVQAFTAYNRFLSAACPGYVRGGSMDGVHRGLGLVDRVLAIVDPKLAAHLVATGMPAEIYGFASVLTLCACTPPLPEVLNLWDFLFAYGPHLNILCIVAQLVLIRDQILDSPSPNQILRAFPPLQAAKIKAMAISFLPKIPPDLYSEIVVHAK